MKFSKGFFILVKGCKEPREGFELSKRNKNQKAALEFDKQIIN